MLSPASLRICCLAVMAPALTKAASQAENFNLPHSPASSNIINPSSPLRIVEDREKNYLDSLHIISSSGGSDTVSKDILKSKVHNDFLQSNFRLCLATRAKQDAWIVDFQRLSVDLTENLQLQFNGDTFKDGHWRNREKCGKTDSSGIKHTPKNCFPLSTMNKDIPVTQDRMGLLSANTSLDCDFKNKFALGHQNAFTTEQQLLIMSPKEPGEISELPSFSDSEETMNHPLTPPASRPGSEPAAGVAPIPAFVSVGELQEVTSRYLSLEKRAEYLINRLRKLQARQAEWHVVGQLRSFVDYQQKSLGIPCQRQNNRNSSCRKVKDPVNLKAELLQSEDVRNLSTAALVNLVRKLESSHASGKLLHSHKSSTLSSNTECCQSGEKDKVNMVKLNIEECTEIRRATGTLLTNLTHLESAMDSDATESSSGGESCDEYERYDERKSHLTPIHKRAAWKWALDRVTVASRWTWLQAQVSDLEYRIRQQNEICRQLRASKGAVILDSSHVCIDEQLDKRLTVSDVKKTGLDSLHEPSSLLVGLEGLSYQSAATSPLLPKHPPKTVNGYLERGTVTSNGYHAVRGVTSSLDHCVDYNLKQDQHQEQFGPGKSNTDPSLSSHCLCNVSRTRPLINFRKRKLLQTKGLHLLSRKAARLSTVRCSCSSQCEMLPCALCGGRYNNIQSVDPEVMPLLERIALLDHYFHPVLSFEHDIPLALHFESLLKTSELHHSAAKSNTAVRKKPRLSTKVKGLNDQARKHSRKLARNAAQTLLSSAKLRKSFGGNKHSTKRHGEFEERSAEHRKRRTAATAETAIEAFKKHQERRRSLSAASSGSSKPNSPVPSPAPSIGESGGNGIPLSTFPASVPGGRPSTLQEILRKKKGDSAFDINNIVIPYSIASSTRVEKLQYKEILTPKWRIIDDDTTLVGDENCSKVEDKEVEEDTSDELISRRHQKCEEEEKKRFSDFSHCPSHGRTRFRGTRTDSRADSSGATTPDPLSPHLPDFMGQDSNSIPTGGPYSPAISPPSTPIPLAVWSDDSQPLLCRSERKHSTSLSKRERCAEEMRVPATELAYVPPYEPRTFPLSDEEYEEMLKKSHHLAIFDCPTITEHLPIKEPSSPNSPVSSSSTSSALEDDPTDPEWTVVTHDKGPQQSLVLKLAKR